MNKTLASLVIIAFLLCPLYTGCGPKNTELAEPLSDSSFPGSSFSVDSTTQPVAQGISGISQKMVLKMFDLMRILSFLVI